MVALQHGRVAFLLSARVALTTRRHLVRRSHRGHVASSDGPAVGASASADDCVGTRHPSREVAAASRARTAAASPTAAAMAAVVAAFGVGRTTHRRAPPIVHDARLAGGQWHVNVTLPPVPHGVGAVAKALAADAAPKPPVPVVGVPKVLLQRLVRGHGLRALGARERAFPIVDSHEVLAQQ